ncbi:MAG: helix-turn-helix transcriptional regulator [Candidatus Melainabacteria bacterium]|nr:helix-turn-helix transcriptional regulator [Candidatus Melainabacteria bacterium]
MHHHQPGQEHNDAAPDIICPIIFLLEILSARWTIEVLRELFIQPTRTRKFLTLIPGLNMKTLRERLKMLEAYELVNRKVYSDLPLRVEYSLTQKGRELYEVLVSLKQLGARWLGTDCTCPFERATSDNASGIHCPGRPAERH